MLDCPLSISLVPENVMHAADVLLVPLIPTTLPVRTLDQLTEFAGGFNGRQPEVRAFFSMVDRRMRLHQDITAKLSAERGRRGSYPDSGFVSQRAHVRRACPGHRVRPRSQAARAFRARWAEVASPQRVLHGTPAPGRPAPRLGLLERRVA